MSTSWKVIFDFILLAIIYRAIFYSRWKLLNKRDFIIRTVFYIYISIVIYLTLMPILTSLPSVFDGDYVPMFLKPFDDYIHSKGDATFQLIINVLMFVPFGFMLPMIKKCNIFTVALYSFLFTLSIEVLQPLLNSFRISDITDVITNTTGGIIGYILYIIAYKIHKKYKPEEN